MHAMHKFEKKDLLPLPAEGPWIKLFEEIL